MRHREYNLSVGFMGVQGSGKTDAAVAKLIELSKTSYVLAHDGSYAIPDELHDGTRVPIIRYDSLGDMKARIARDPRGIHAVATVSLRQLLDYACRLSCASLGAQPAMLQGAQLVTPKNVTRPEGAPVTVYIDEVVMASEMSPQRFDPVLKELVTQRRHKHVGLVWGTQSPALIHYQLLQLGTEVQLFRCAGKQAGDRLSEAGVPESIISECLRLPKHESIHYVMGTDPDDVESEETPDASENEVTDESQEQSVTPSDETLPAVTPPTETPSVN